MRFGIRLTHHRRNMEGKTGEKVKMDILDVIDTLNLTARRIIQVFILLFFMAIFSFMIWGLYMVWQSKRNPPDPSNPYQQYILARIYAKDNPAEAVKWYRKAAEQDHDDAQCALALCYYTGKGVEKDLAKAVEWWRKAADQDHDEALYRLGLCYYNGEGVEKDPAEAER